MTDEAVRFELIEEARFNTMLRALLYDPERREIYRDAFVELAKCGVDPEQIRELAKSFAEGANETREEREFRLELRHVADRDNQQPLRNVFIELIKSGLAVHELEELARDPHSASAPEAINRAAVIERRAKRNFKENKFSLGYPRTSWKELQYAVKQVFRREVIDQMRKNNEL